MYQNETRPAPNAPGDLQTRSVYDRRTSALRPSHSVGADAHIGPPTSDKPPSPLSPVSLEAVEQLAAAAKLVLGELHNAPQEGWRITSEVTRDRVYVYILKGNRVIGSGFSYVRTNRQNTDSEMAQCFSYAAHQAYKNAQWREEFCHE